jgi:hypothetical protein
MAFLGAGEQALRQGVRAREGQIWCRGAIDLT